MKKIILLGATGFLGQQVLDIVRENRDCFQLIGISGKTKRSLLQKFAREFDIPFVNISYGSHESLMNLVQRPEADFVINTLVGSVGIEPTFAALHAGKTVVLGNKEAFVSKGPLLMEEARCNGVKIIPIDSELTSLFFMLDSHPARDIEKIIITASGGPFFGKSREELKYVIVEDALDHPTWKMGPKVTIDSATLMNKAFELIAAHYLFGVSLDQIEILIHRESIIHALVQFRDGTMLAAMSFPDMRFAIHAALFYPERVSNNLRRLDLTELPGNSLHFEKPDFSLFKGPVLAREALKKGGHFPALLNEANEIAVQKFLNREIGFLEIYDFIEQRYNSGHGNGYSFSSGKRKTIRFAK